MTSGSRHDRRLDLVEATGPRPFRTRRVYRRQDGSRHVWESRHHRKNLPGAEPTRLAGLGGLLLRGAWNPGALNWWIGTVFALGSSLFMLGCLLILVPGLAEQWSYSEHQVNMVFFAGSIPFTTAAYLQLFQAANAGDFPSHGQGGSRKAVPFGWRPKDIGWLSCALQFMGTILFNFNTFDALLPGLDWVEEDLVIWVPNFAGSVLFLGSGHLAFAEAGHAHFSWQPKNLSWWVTFINLLGCIGFMISAVFAVVLPTPPVFDAVTISVFFTLLGATGFLVGSLLMLPETAATGEA
ncbi:MAG: hypothetical protein OES37_03625 [Chromatiales bacterium]|nr:hypothetical protein [Chromatiales bacterium]